MFHPAMQPLFERQRKPITIFAAKLVLDHVLYTSRKCTVVLANSVSTPSKPIRAKAAATVSTTVWVGVVLSKFAQTNHF
jgi:hypothetical protein